MKIKCIVVLFFLFSFASQAEEKNPVAQVNNSNLQTDLSFEDALVNAKHHGADEAIITVGADKVLDALLGVKKNFKDRVKKNFYKF